MLRVGRNREKHKRLPKGWAPAKSGAIYFRPTNAADKAIITALRPESMLLGATEDEAARNPLWLKILAARTKEESIVAGTVGEIVARARRELLPAIDNAKTREERTRHINELERIFGTRRYARHAVEAQKPEFFKALDVQRHVHASRESRPVAANREARTWEIVFEDARRLWGLTEYNPCAGLRYNPEAPREVLPDDAGIFRAFRELDPPMRFMVGMIRFYGRRKGEVLRLQVSSAQTDGLHLRRGKRSREIVIRWDTRLERMWARLLRWRAARYRSGKPTTMALLNRRGRPYTVSGFNSAWRRAMVRAELRGAFTFHDIRATRASTLTREQAVEVLAHDDPATTARVYRRGPLVIDLRTPADSRNDSRKFTKNRS
jgi:hypothetical protein